MLAKADIDMKVEKSACPFFDYAEQFKGLSVSKFTYSGITLCVYAFWSLN